METSPAEVTALLNKLADGDSSVLARLMPLIYDELHRRAAAYMLHERSTHTLQPTALVHETYLKLVEQNKTSFKNRAHFMAVAAKLMRRILIDHARARLSEKRGGGQFPDSWNGSFAVSINSQEELLAVNDALQTLQAIDSRQAEIVELRFFGGLTVEETAEALGTSTRTVEREWTVARAWLYSQLSKPESGNEL